MEQKRNLFTIDHVTLLKINNKKSIQNTVRATWMNVIFLVTFTSYFFDEFNVSVKINIHTDFAKYVVKCRFCFQFCGAAKVKNVASVC